MTNFLHIMSYEWRKLSRNPILGILILVFLGAGIYAIYFGKAERDKYQNRIDDVQLHEQQQFDSLLSWVVLDTTVAKNKPKFAKAVSPTGVGRSRHFTYYIANDIPVFAGLCLGQRDLYPAYYGINVGDLARQINVGELANPMKLLTGNFDLSYVFIFLLPLILISLFYNLFSAEKESGTLPLLKAQPIAFTQVLIGKGVIRLLIVWILTVALLTMGFVFQGIPLAENMASYFQWLSVLTIYILFWTAIMSLIVSFKKDSSLSAMLGLGMWLIFTIISPALINLFISAKEPLPNRAEAVHKIRTYNGKIWDSPKSFVLDKFYGTNPQYDDGDTTTFEKWYYAGFVLLDQEVNDLNNIFESQVAQRNQLIDKWEWLAPAAVVQRRLSEISQTDRKSHQAFLAELRSYHAALKDVYYPKIFNDQAFTLSDLERLNEGLNH